jgi:hypothetical protein
MPFSEDYDAESARQDRLVIDQLRQAGADVQQPRRVRHYLYFPDEQAARRAAKALGGQGFSVDVELNHDAELWRVAAQHVIRAEATVIGQVVSQLTHLARSFGGELDRRANIGPRHVDK